MGKILFDDQYYAEQAHAEAPWLIRNEEYRVVGHYTALDGVVWGSAMTEADKAWLGDLIPKKLASLGSRNPGCSRACDSFQATKPDD